FLGLKALSGAERRVPVTEAVVTIILLTSVLGYGFIRKGRVDAAVSGWEELEVALAQGNIDQSFKWDPAFQQKSIALYRDLTIKAGKDGAELVVWPETAVPFYLESDPMGPVVLDIANEAGVRILTGAPAYDPDIRAGGGGGGGRNYFNSAYLIAPPGIITGRYDKIHLVPFGEYVPLKKLLFFVDKLTHGIGDFTPGTSTEPLKFGRPGGKGGVGLGVLICYEAIFPAIARAFVRDGATLLVNVTNDAWFGKTSAPYQHLAMTAVRAVENRVFLVRAANTGISAIVDPAGRIIERSELFEEALVMGSVGLRQGGKSFYTLYGDVFALGCLALTGVFIALGLNRRRY
ncbi:MAG: apolipoprotein N-acyltransferase, partial [Thermodesulfobacteriota bacterium]